MKIEDQVCSLELAKELKDLGVKQESYAYWRFPCDLFLNKHPETKYYLVLNHSKETPASVWKLASAFTVAELGDMFPFEGSLAYSSKMGEEWWCNFANEEHEGVLKLSHTEKAKTEVDARAKMLIHLIKTGVVKP